MSTVRRSRPASASTHRDPLLHSSTGTGSLSFTPSLSALPAAHSHSHVHLDSRPRSGDVEELTKQVRDLKETLLERDQECAFLKAQLQRLIAQLRKKERQIDQITAMKIAAATSDASGEAVIAGQIRDLRSELTAISRLSEKNRDMESELYKRDEELRKLKANLKYTQGKELEIEAQLYYNELRRTRKQLLVTQNQVKALQNQMSLSLPSYSNSNSTSPHHSKQPSHSAAYDQAMFHSLRQEVEELRSENLRLRNGGFGGGAGSGNNSARKSSQLHVLNTITQLQKDLQSQIDAEAEEQQEKQQRQQQQQEDQEQESARQDYHDAEQQDEDAQYYHHHQQSDSDAYYQQQGSEAPQYDDSQSQQQQQSGDEYSTNQGQDNETGEYEDDYHPYEPSQASSHASTSRNQQQWQEELNEDY